MDLLLKAPVEYEPLRKNRFLMRFPSDLGIQEWWIQSASRPSWNTTAVEIPFLNTSTYVAGRYKWDQINLSLRDPIGPSASQAVMEWVRLCAESVTGRMGYAVSYMRDIQLECLDPTGTAIQLWILKNCMPVNAKFGDLAYNSDELATIDLTLQPQYCVLVY